MKSALSHASKRSRCKEKEGEGARERHRQKETERKGETQYTKKNLAPEICT